MQEAIEESLLAIFAQHPEALRFSQHALTAEMFSADNQPIFRELLAGVATDQTPDLIVTTSKLRHSGDLDRVGGPARLSELWTAPVLAKNAPRLVHDLRRGYEVRKRIDALQNAKEMLETAVIAGQDLTEISQQVDAMLTEAGRIPGKPLASKTLGTALLDTVDEIETRMMRGGALPGISTGFPTIDRKTQGMQPGRVWVIAGKPGDGKSVLMQNFLEAAIEQGKSVRMYPLEMSQQEQAYRILCSQGNLDNQLVWKGMMSRAEQAALHESIKRLHKAKAEIVDCDGATATDILNDIEQCSADVIMVDYLQLLEDEGRKGGTREELVASISRRLKRTAVRSKKVVLTASQLNDNNQLRESRAIGQDADHILFLEKVGDNDATRKVNCQKNRTGERFWTLDLDFLGQYYKFREPTTP
jgi:replicative DNA helicase